MTPKKNLSTKTNATKTIYTPGEWHFEIQDGEEIRQIDLTGGNVNFGGGAPWFHFAFSSPTFSGWTYLEAGEHSFTLSSDDNAGMSVAGVGFSSTLNNPDTKSVVIGKSGWYPVSASMNTIGGPYALGGVPPIYIAKEIPIEPPEPIPPTDDEEPCECPPCEEGTQTSNGSVSFTQAFGRISHAPEFYTGTLRINERNFSERLFSPECLSFIHPITRKVLEKNASAQSAKIIDARGTEYNYTAGKPSGNYVWGDSGIAVNSDGSVVERLADRSEIIYDADGNVSALKSPAGTTLTLAQIGLEVVRDGNDFIRQIWSLADGLLDVATIDEHSFTVSWIKPSDVGTKNTSGLYTFSVAPIKQFIFEVKVDLENISSFSLKEKRGTSFEFNYSWEFDSLLNKWTFVRGNGVESITSVKTKTTNSDNTFTTVETLTNSAGTKTAEEVFSNTADGEMRVCSKHGSETDWNSTRVMSGSGRGKIASTTDKSGNATAYTYDAYNRTLSEQTTGFASLVKRREYTYATVPAGTVPDRRPLSITHKISGAIFKTETFSYTEPTAAAGKIETYSVEAAGTTLTTTTRYFPISQTIASGRIMRIERADGTATNYEYSSTDIPASVTPLSNLEYAEIVTEGVMTNGEFSTVSGKSTRIVRTVDTRENVVGEENFVHDGNKNVSEVFFLANQNEIGAHYEYAPFGAITRTSKNTPSSVDIINQNPFRFSSEFHDPELGLVYYNYRHYSPTDGRFPSRDPIEEQGGLNLYAFLKNKFFMSFDVLGMWIATEKSIGAARRIYVRGKGDTKGGLASLVGLDAGEFDRWAIPVGEISESSKMACKYSVPNIWIAANLLQGGGIYSRIVNIGGSIGVFIGTDVFTSGYKIIKPTKASELGSIINSNKNNIWGMVVFAHGNSDSGFNVVLGRYSVGDFITDYDWTDYIKQSSLRASLPTYKLSKIYMMQCYGAAGGHREAWRRKAIDFWGYTGIDFLGVDLGSCVFPWN